MSYPTFLSPVERACRNERERQDDKWGEQNHPDGTGGDRAEQVRNAAQARCQEAASRGAVDWSMILAEEVFEAIAETDPAKLRVELIQVAAVCQSWIEAIDRRVWRSGVASALAALGPACSGCEVLEAVCREQGTHCCDVCQHQPKET